MSPFPSLARITRGQGQLRSLRGLVEEVYRLFDRRCRTATALVKLTRLRARLRRFVRLERDRWEVVDVWRSRGMWT